MRRITVIVGLILLAPLTASQAGAEPTTQPLQATVPPLPFYVQEKIRVAQSEIDRSKLSLQELLKAQLRATIGQNDKHLYGGRNPTTQPLNAPADMPRGSQPRQFNGFTYYIVPLSH